MTSPSDYQSNSSLATTYSNAPKLSKALSNKYDYLYEVDILKENQKISDTYLPLLNPYSAFAKRSVTPWSQIRSLVQSKPRHVKEYVAASKLDQHPVFATGEEQFVTLHIPEEFASHWKSHQFTHIHFGAVKIALTYHGRKGQPVVARLALLDTRYLEYQHANLGTAEITLNAGTVFITLFPNFTMSLSDANLSTALKIQVQIQGAPLTKDSIQATLHYQIAWRVQNHAMDLTLPGGEEALFLKIDAGNGATQCTQVPRQLSKEDLIKILPDSWVTNYEKLKEPEEPLRSTEVSMSKRHDKSVAISFDHSHYKKLRNTHHFMGMISDDVIVLDDPETFSKTLPSLMQTHDWIHHFQLDGRAVSWYKDPFDGHCPWDIDCQCYSCLYSEDEEDFEDGFPTKYKGIPRPGSIAERKMQEEVNLKKLYEDKDPFVGSLSRPGKYEYLVRYDAPSWAKDPHLTVEPTGWDSDEPIQPKQPFITRNTLPKIYMFNPLNYENNFPPLSSFSKDGADHTPKIPKRNVVLPSGAKDPTGDLEATVNWQTENALAQNRMLTTIDRTLKETVTKVDRVTDQSSKNQGLIRVLEQQLQDLNKRICPPGTSLFHFFDQQKSEMASLKEQIRLLKEQPQKNETDTPSYQSSYQPFHNFSSPYMPSNPPNSPFTNFANTPQPQPSLFSQYPIQPKSPNTFDLAKLVWEKKDAIAAEKRAKKKLQKDEVKQKTSLPPESKRPDPQSSSHLGDQFMISDPALPKVYALNEPSVPSEDTSSQSYISTEESVEDTDSFSVVSEESTQLSQLSSSSNDSPENNENTLPQTFMVRPTEPEISEVEDEVDGMTEEPIPERRPEITPPKMVGTGFHTFSLDDISITKWPERIQDFHTWMLTKQLVEREPFLILSEFTARLSGTLREWWNSVGPDDKNRFLTSQDFTWNIRILYSYFCGDQSQNKEELRRQIFEMKCLSYDRKKIDRHFQRMIKLFYHIGGDISLKQAFISSLPPILSERISALIKERGTSVTQMHVGDIRQTAFYVLDDLCSKRKFFNQMKKMSRDLEKACTKSDLIIKGDKGCSGYCNPSRRRKYKRFKLPSFKERDGRQYRKRRRFFRKSKTSKSMRQKPRSCFTCGKIGHFSRNCPQNKKSIKLISEIQKYTGIDIEDDLESVFSIEDEPSEDTLFSLEFYEEYAGEQYQITSYEAPKTENPPLPKIHTIVEIPQTEVKVYTSKWDKPISVIAFYDTGAAYSIMDPAILPSEYWIPHFRHFGTADDGILTTTVKTKHPITIEFFPGFKYTTKLLGSDIPGKDLLIGFDIYRQLNNKLRIGADGIRWKNQFKRYTEIPRLFQLTTSNELQQLEDVIKNQLCAESHVDFLSKCSHPLWLNQDFFIKLPFKKNENINPTKASHSGMNPEHLQLAIKECDELQQFDLIEPSDSQWACEAFYVNKRSEQVRGKLRLVINYQPLNHFLQDDKFPIPNKLTLFSHLSKAKLFSKFDLKSGFWQLGIHPNERPKTGFCIPDRHFQWKVMPFGLKTAPSLFQKAMIKIFQPILFSALVYIDDILLFSETLEDHIKLLNQFISLVKKFGVMLSAKKMILAQNKIQFLGMDFADGTFSPAGHISLELQKFPDTNLSVKQIQQFLGIVNYIRDFIPEVTEHISPLSDMLKKKPPAWGKCQDNAVKQLKQLAQQVKSLHIPSEGKKILQTDASDQYWSAVLLEEHNGKRKICGFASGKFKVSEQHYHSTFKEILAVKNGIKKFNFFLIHTNFLVEMDMRAFPKMIRLNPKIVPNSQLLRWAQWFSPYQFEVKHLKGKDNILADFLSRPHEFSQRLKNSPKVLMFQRKTRSNSTKSKGDSSQSTGSSYKLSHNLPENPPEAFDLDYPWDTSVFLERRTFYELQVFKKYGGSILRPFGVDPEYPFAHIFIPNPTDFSEDLLWMFWYLLNHFHILMEFRCSKFSKFDQVNPWMMKFLLWFNNHNYWTSLFKCMKGIKKYVVIWFYRPVNYYQGKLCALPHSSIVKWNHVSVLNDEDEYSELQRFIFQENKCIPKEIWPGSLGSWNYGNSDHPHGQWIRDALREYREMNDYFQDAQDPYPAYSKVDLTQEELNTLRITRSYGSSSEDADMVKRSIYTVQSNIVKDSPRKRKGKAKSRSSTRSEKRRAKNKCKYRSLHGEDWWIELGYSTKPSTPSWTQDSSSEPCI
uniref:Polyprotein n=1 Tax=Petunia vein clearing virus TaxID=59504 RepID=A0A6M4W4X9_9VIRU|nr:polyprotein [Petunia vein clearing virus]